MGRAHPTREKRRDITAVALFRWGGRSSPFSVFSCRAGFPLLLPLEVWSGGESHESSNLAFEKLLVLHSNEAQRS